MEASNPPVYNHLEERAGAKSTLGSFEDGFENGFKQINKLILKEHNLSSRNDYSSLTLNTSPV